MRYEPLKEDLEYIQQFRKERKHKSGISEGKKMFVLAQIPENLWRTKQEEYSRTHPKKLWTDDEPELIKFLAQNPQYKVGNPSL